MTVIDAETADAHLTEVWDAMFRDGQVSFRREGRVQTVMRWAGLTADRIELLEELKHTIGYELPADLRVRFE